VGGVEWCYVYDPENRLVEVWRGAERVASFRYDAEGNRTVREVAGLRTVAVDEGYEVRGGVARKVYRLGGEAVAVREGSTVWAVVGDHLDSVTVLAQSGSPMGVTQYLPYGAIWVESGAFSTDRRFTGQREEAALGLYPSLRSGQAFTTPATTTPCWGGSSARTASCRSRATRRG
jgi:YD repeat-containing protein